MFISKQSSPNCYRGRNGHIPELIVCHITEGAYNGAVSWLCNPKSEVSAHFVVAQDGRITQLVELENGSWCNGTTTDPNNSRYFGKSSLEVVRNKKVNANYYTVSIECEGFWAQSKGSLTPSQTDAIVFVIDHIIKEVKRIYDYDIPIDQQHIAGHCHVAPLWKPNCPGQNFPFDEIIERVKELNTSNKKKPAARRTAVHTKEENPVSTTKKEPVKTKNIVSQTQIEINNTIYNVDRILHDNFNFVKLSDLKKANFHISYDPDRKIPVVKNAYQDISENEIESLAKILWAEARGEDLKGQILVINVILNRVKNKKFPDTVEEVIFQTNQFEPTRNGMFEKAQPTNTQYTAITKALCGVDYSQGALYFRTTNGADGSWHDTNLNKLFDHGCHRFYS